MGHQYFSFNRGNLRDKNAATASAPFRTPSPSLNDARNSIPVDAGGVRRYADGCHRTSGNCRPFAASNQQAVQYALDPQPTGGSYATRIVRRTGGIARARGDGDRSGSPPP